MSVAMLLKIVGRFVLSPQTRDEGIDQAPDDAAVR